MRDDDEAPLPARSAEFHFLRVQYTDLPEYHRGWGYSSRDGTGSGWWVVDWPAADNHFTTGVQRLTRIDAGDPLRNRIVQGADAIGVHGIRIGSILQQKKCECFTIARGSQHQRTSILGAGFIHVRAGRQ